jgi:hypothetical protein
LYTYKAMDLYQFAAKGVSDSLSICCFLFWLNFRLDFLIGGLYMNWSELIGQFCCLTSQVSVRIGWVFPKQRAPSLMVFSEQSTPEISSWTMPKIPVAWWWLYIHSFFFDWCQKEFGTTMFGDGPTEKEPIRSVPQIVANILTCHVIKNSYGCVYGSRQ